MHSGFNFLGQTERFPLFNSNGSIFSDLFKDISDQISYFFILSRNRRYLLDFFFTISDLLGFSFNFRYEFLNRLMKPLSKRERIDSRPDISESFARHRLCKHNGRSCSISCFFIGFFSSFFEHACTNVFGFVFKFNFFGYGHSIIRYNRSSIGSFKDNISSFWSHCDLHGICNHLHSAKDFFSGFITILNVFWHSCLIVKE